MLLAETRTLHGDATGEEVDGDLPVGTGNDGIPFRAVRVGDNKEDTVGSVQGGISGVGETVVLLKAPDDVPITAPPPTAMREERLGVEAVDEWRMQVVLRLRTEEMTDAVHGAKIQILFESYCSITNKKAEKS